VTRILVTGATGFIGRPLVIALAQSHQVRAAVRRSPALPFPAGVECALHADLASSINWTPLLRDIDTVIHLAGIAHIGRGVKDEVYDRVNRGATADLAIAAANAGVRHFIFLSSIRAQSGATAVNTLTESDAARPTDAYGRSKLAAEGAVRASGVPFTILRPTLVFGSGAKGNLATLQRIATLPIPLPFGSFSNRRSLVSLENLMSAIQFAMENSSAIGQTYVVADPTPLSLADIIGALRAGFGRSPGLVPFPQALLRAMLTLCGCASLWQRIGGELVADPSKLIAAGWQPSGDTAKALQRLAAAGRAR
jgi:UDP-glucose 4-epimerase